MGGEGKQGRPKLGDRWYWRGFPLSIEKPCSGLQEPPSYGQRRSYFLSGCPFPVWLSQNRRYTTNGSMSEIACGC